MYLKNYFTYIDTLNSRKKNIKKIINIYEGFEKVLN
jgi:hypothetical protein